MIQIFSSGMQKIDKKILLFIGLGLAFAAPGLMFKFGNWLELQSKANEIKSSPIVLQAFINNPAVTVSSEINNTDQTQSQEMHTAATEAGDAQLNSAGAIQATTGAAQNLPNVAAGSCEYNKPEKVEYVGKLVSIQKTPTVAPGEAFKTEIYIENIGNVPWFSDASNCNPQNPVYLGTSHEKDRLSQFADASFGDSNWINGNRIKMDTSRVNPGGVAKFIFWSKAPLEAGYYREFFSPVAEGLTWIENEEAEVALDLRVGDFEFTQEQEQILPFIDISTNLTKLDFSSKKVEVSLKEQRMWLKIGGTAINTFRVSTGSYKTPTPKGSFKILLKQDVRIGGKAPHYIMPQFMMFKAGGYGFHALPSLATDKGVFWREALNHIGTPVSHGCVRLLPGDAKVVYDFADIGTKVEIRA